MMALILRAPGSRESLSLQLADLGRTRKLVTIVAGVCTFLAGVLGCLLLACAADAAVHLPPLARALMLVGTLALGGILWLRGPARAFLLRTDPLSVALELEERFPALNDALGSAVSFSDGPDADARGVSRRLEAAAVRSARRLADRYEFSQLVPTGACWRAVWALGILFAAAVPLVLVNGNRAATALVRFADPFGAHPWPTRTRIEILVPEFLPVRIPRGEPFDLKFVVRGELPERAVVVFRFVGGEEFEEQYPLAASSDSRNAGGAVVAARIDPNRLPSPFAFRIIANDADTGWQDVDVVPPPRLVPLNGRATPQFQVTPPEYTGLPFAELPDGAVVLEVPVGTIVAMRAATDVRLSAASLAYLGDRSAVQQAAPFAALGHLFAFSAGGSLVLADAIGRDIPLSLDSAGRVLGGIFAPSLSGMYALRLTDETGLTGTRLIEIRLVPDPSPIVALLRPTVGKDPTIRTPDAAIPIHLAADDKVYGVRRTFLEYRVGRDGAVRTLILGDARDARAGFLALGGGFLASARARPTLVDSRRQVPLSLFRHDDGTPLRDGDSLFLLGAADDWDDVSPLKPPGRSENEIEIRIAAAEVIEAWLQHELAALRPDLLRLRDQQRDARLRTADAAPLPDGTLVPADRDRLLAAEQVQRQIRGKIGDPNDGLRAKADLLRETIRANDLAMSNTSRRVERVAEVLGALADRDLPAIEPSLAEARQIGAQTPRTGQDPIVPDLLKRAGRQQKSAEDGLSGLLELLADWGGAIEVRSEARALRDLLNRSAEEMEQQSDRIPPGKPVEALTPAQRADLDRAATRVEQAAEQAGSLLARAARFAGEKEKQAAAAKAAARAKEKDSQALRDQAAALPAGTPEKSRLNAQANALKTEADELASAAGKASAEAAALRAGISSSGGQTLPDELRAGFEAIRNNRQSEGTSLQRSAAARLDKLIGALNEKPPDAAPNLEKWKKSADEVNTLADAQDKLRNRAAEANRISDPARRDAELKKLAAEQDRLIDRGKDLLNRLTRENADAAARETRAAIERMETARDDLERGNSGIRPQNDAVEKLDTARDRLDAAAANPQHRLADEKRRKMADTVAALLERQRAAIAEAERIHRRVAANTKWDRPLLTSYGELAERRQRPLAADVKELEKSFEELPVLARVIAETMSAMEAASDRINRHRDDARDALDDNPDAAFDKELETANNRKVLRPMNLAARRLAQLLDALKADDPKPAPSQKEGGNKPPDAQGPANGSKPPPNGSEPDLVPPLAQLKVLRALQTELNERTAEFAKDHPDSTKLTDDERAELKELEQAQRDIAALFEQLARLFDEQRQSKPDQPDGGKRP